MGKWILTLAEPDQAMLSIARAPLPGEWLDEHTMVVGHPAPVYRAMLAMAPSPADDAELVEEVAKSMFKIEFKKLRGAKWEAETGDMREYWLTSAKAVLSLLSGEGK